MRLDKLLEQSENLQEALEKMGIANTRRKAQDDIFVHAYVVRSFWRKYPAKWRKQHKLAMVHGGRK